MKNPRILTIDLGSSYTKIAVRYGWKGDTVLLDRLPLASEDISFCVPSIVARVARSSGDVWLIGAEASERRPAADVRIFRYWKAGLFPPEPHESGTTDSRRQIPEREESLQVAVKFFSILREKLATMGRETKLSQLPVRVCIPRIGDFGRAEQTIQDVLRAAGWQTSETRVAVSEPESNAMGLLTRGSNVTWTPRAMDFMPLPDRSVHLPQMIKSKQMLSAMKNMKGCYSVFVIDIGAYTTDFGFVKFDTTFETDLLNRPQIMQKSYPAGIGDLDGAIFGRLSGDKQDAIKGLATNEWERRKPALYRGEEIAVPDSRGGILKIGKGRDLDVIGEEIDAFSQKIWELRNTFIRSVGAGEIHCEALTGGGSLIPRIKETVAEFIRKDVGDRRQDFLGALEDPDADLLPNLNAAERDAYALKSRQLMRGGSAVGGASVFFE